jgi:hypothetical protein
MITAAIGSAGTLTDTFGQSQGSGPGCNNNYNYTSSGACDVIGADNLFDIQKASVTVDSNNLATVTLYSNLGGVSGSTLNGYTDGSIKLLAGDLFFYSAASITATTAVGNFVDPKVTDFANPTTNIEPYLTYAVPLVSHDNLTVGDLYKVASGSIETASQALATNNTASSLGNSVYRNNLPTLFTAGTNQDQGKTQYSETVTSTGDNGTNTGTNPGALYAVTLKFWVPSSFTALESSTGSIGILWSSADCGNDFIQGTTTPEPSSFALLLGGAMLIAGSVFARRSAARSRS